MRATWIIKVIINTRRELVTLLAKLAQLANKGYKLVCAGICLCIHQMREMLEGSPDRCDETNIGNVENNNPISSISRSDGVKIGIKPRQAMLKKGGRKLRSTAPCPQRPLHHQKAQRSSPIGRLSDYNNNVSASAGTKPTAQPGAGLPVGSQTVPTLHHLKQGTKKEVR